MSTLAVHAYAFASTFRLKDFTTAFPTAELILEKDQLIIQHPKVNNQYRLIILFDFGAAVLTGFDTLEREQLIKTILNIQNQEQHAPLTEDFLIEVHPGANIEVKFDRVIVPEVNLPILAIISLLLAQSAAMDYYQEDVQETIERTKHITSSLQHAGRLPGRINALVKFIGACISTKNDVISTLSLFDKPESTWESPELDKLYNALRQELEINDRFRALEAKLRIIQDSLSLIVDLANQRSTFRLEFTVVLLILTEVIITVWQLFAGHH